MSRNMTMKCRPSPDSACNIVKHVAGALIPFAIGFLIGLSIHYSNVMKGYGYKPFQCTITAVDRLSGRCVSMHPFGGPCYEYMFHVSLLRTHNPIEYDGILIGPIYSSTIVHDVGTTHKCFVKVVAGQVQDSAYWTIASPQEVRKARNMFIVSIAVAAVTIMALTCSCCYFRRRPYDPVPKSSYTAIP